MQCVTGMPPIPFGLHCTSQAPQWLLLVCRFVQIVPPGPGPGHDVSPPPHWHLPATQLLFMPKHWLKHIPQFCGSVMTSTQPWPPPHIIWPPPHTHWPETQVPAPQS